MKKVYAIALTALLTASCVAQSQDNLPVTFTTEPATEPATEADFYPSPGSNERLRAPITNAEGLEVIISDVLVPPNATVPRHYHPGEEFLYVIEGSAVHVEEGKPDQILKAGDAYVIPPETEHAPRAGENGARAIVFRIHIEGEEERILVE